MVGVGEAFKITMNLYDLGDFLRSISGRFFDFLDHNFLLIMLFHQFRDNFYLGDF